MIAEVATLLIPARVVAAGTSLEDLLLRRAIEIICELQGSLGSIKPKLCGSRTCTPPAHHTNGVITRTKPSQYEISPGNSYSIQGKKVFR